MKVREKATISEDTWRAIQRHLGLSDAEMEQFQADPRNADVVAQARALIGKRLVAEVVSSTGCNSHHRVGDQFVFDGVGNLITAGAPKRVCIFALNALAPLLYTATEMMYAGVDPNEMRFKRAGCIDVGLACGGWGHVVMELRVKDST